MITPSNRMSRSMPSMSVNEIALDSVLFQVNHEYREEEGQEGFAYGLKLESRLDEDNNALSVKLGAETPKLEEKPNYPFYFDVTVAGFFEFTVPLDEALRKQYAIINCPAILFPYLRETLADLTRRAGFPPLHLPRTNFVKFAREKTGAPEEPPLEPKKSFRKPSKAASQGRKKRTGNQEA